MLEFVHDNRSGEKLEIIIPTFNEQERILLFFQYYGAYFDIIILDDDSTDCTRQRVIELGGSVFRRTLKSDPGEAHIAYYINSLTRSGRIIYLCADEFVDLTEIQEVDRYLRNGNCHIFSRRIDWMHGKRLNFERDGQPRAFRRGSAEWVDGLTHSALRYQDQDDRDIPRYRVNVHHLHITLASKQYGNTGKYAGMEIEDYQKTRWPYLRFLRRFFVSEVLLIPRKLWRERDKSGIFLLYFTLLSLTTALIGTLCWIEAKYLPGLEEQQDQYAGFYRPGSESVS